MIKVAINGFGRIGRSVLKVAIEKHLNEIEIVAVNDLADSKMLAHLLQYDSNYGPWKDHIITATEDTIIVDDKHIKVCSEKDPAQLPWGELGVDIVVESTGRFTDIESAGAHIKAGAKKVVISAPSKGANPAPTYVLGVNKYDGQAEIINNASCTTNCISPVIRVLSQKFGINKALMTTVHSFTQDQELQDGPHKDYRRARSAPQSIIPTSTGAAIATTETQPDLRGKFDGVSLRVPTAVGSISDITAVLGREATVKEINDAFIEAASQENYKGILAVTDEPLVSKDIVGRSESAIVDLELTQSLGDLVKVFAWYDNEWGYSNRLVEQVVVVGQSN
jgi:glyceraldehyde 3-phosphate dehydrogenase